MKRKQIVIIVVFVKVFLSQNTVFCQKISLDSVGGICDIVKQDSASYNIGATDTITFYPFFKCSLHIDSTFSGIDTVFMKYTSEITMTVIAEFKDGKSINVTGYYPGGEIYCQSSFKDNERHGLFILNFENGQKKIQGYYNFGKSILPSISWYNTGELETFNNRDEDKNTGWAKCWFENGKLESETIAIDSTKYGLIMRSYYNNGQLNREFKANIGKSDYIVYYKDGTNKIQGTVFNGPWNEVGHWQEWHENGQLSREYFYHDSIPNQPEGTWKWWDEEGNLIKQETYKNGELIDSKDFINKKKKGE